MRQDNQSTTPTLLEAIQTVIDSNLIDLHVSLPAKIVTYDPITQFGSVKIQIMFEYENGTLQEYPVISNVPIKHPRAAGGKAFVHMPLTAGDDVMLIVAERSLDNWKTQGGMTNPDDRRKFNITDCYALVGGSALPDAFTVNNPNSIEIVNGSAQMQLLPSGNINLGSFAPTHPVALGDNVLTRIQAVEMSLSSLISTFNMHMHPTASPGPPSPPTSPASPYSAPSDPLGSSKVKVVT